MNRRCLGQIQQGLSVLEYDSLKEIESELQGGVNATGDEVMIICEMFPSRNNPFAKEFRLATSALEQCEVAVAREIEYRNNEQRDSGDYSDIMRVLKMHCEFETWPNWDHYRDMLNTEYDSTLVNLAIDEAKEIEKEGSWEGW